MRLIDADALKERAIRVSTVKEHCYMKAVGTKEIDKAPTIDAAPVVHGKWLDVFTGFNFFAATCSVCHKRSDLPPIAVAKYCPRCGARMDGDFR